MANYSEILLQMRHDDHDHDEEESTSGVTVAKAVTMCVLFLTSFIVGTLPIYLSRIFKWHVDVKRNKVVLRMLCFGGGVLMCTVFLHLLPEVSENIESLQSASLFPTFDNFELHMAEFLMCSGFFILYFVEELIHGYLHRREKDQMVKQLTRTFSIRRGCNSSNSDEKKPAANSVENGSPLKNETVRTHIDHSHADHSHVNFDDSFLKSFRGFFIVLALSLHELFEGLSIGLESSSVNVWYMFAAVSAHKIVIAFCIGVELVASEISKILTVIYVFTFAVVSPIGIGIGIILSEDEQESSEVVSVILQGLASGTLLYIVFFEILRTDRKGGLLTFLAVFVGFGIMFCISVFIPHGHDHDHSH